MVIAAKGSDKRENLHYLDNRSPYQGWTCTAEFPVGHYYRLIFSRTADF
jgi:hypothetical protein